MSDRDVGQQPFVFREFSKSEWCGQGTLSKPTGRESDGIFDTG